jgi:hypothetical protein
MRKANAHAIQALDSLDAWPFDMRRRTQAGGKAVSFGRQKNLVRRPVRPDGRFTRDIRRRSVGKTTLLDVGSQKQTLGMRLVKIIGKLFGK